MTDYSDSNDPPSLNDVVHQISHALAALDRLIAHHETKTAKGQRTLRRMIRKLCLPGQVSPEKRVKKITSLMRHFVFLCRLDGCRSELQSIREDFILLESGQRVPASDIPYWRREFYADMAALLALDQDFFPKTRKTTFSGNGVPFYFAGGNDLLQNIFRKVCPYRDSAKICKRVQAVLPLKPELPLVAPITFFT